MEQFVKDLKDYCRFGEDRVYVLLAIARSKENEEFSTNSEPTMREVVKDEDELERKIEQLDHAASRSDSTFRLYISANARNTMKAFFKLRGEMDDWLQMRLSGNQGIKKKFKDIDREFKSVLQKHGCRDETNFIFDIDDTDKEGFEQMKQDLEELTEVKLTRETPNGFHIVTEPFNFNNLEAEVEHELKKDGMIFLKYTGENNE